MYMSPSISHCPPCLTRFLSVAAFLLSSAARISRFQFAPAHEFMLPKLLKTEVDKNFCLRGCPGRSVPPWNQEPPEDPAESNSKSWRVDTDSGLPELRGP